MDRILVNEELYRDDTDIEDVRVIVDELLISFQVDICLPGLELAINVGLVSPVDISAASGPGLGYLSLFLVPVPGSGAPRSQLLSVTFLWPRL